MDGSVTVHMNAPAEKIWNLIADVRNTGKFSPEVFEAEWLDGASGPELGAKFRANAGGASAMPPLPPKAAPAPPVWLNRRSLQRMGVLSRGDHKPAH